MTANQRRQPAWTKRMLVDAVVLFALAAFLGAGCSTGPTLNPVEGKVTYKGKEAAGATVIFHPKDGDPVKSPRSTGLTAEDGTFKLSTGDKLGAPAGTYVVTLIWSKEVPSKQKKGELNFNMAPETYDVFDGAYADISKSKIQISVKAGSNKLEPFRLE
jgi:hypothetical protein